MSCLNVFKLRRHAWTLRQIRAAALVEMLECRLVCVHAAPPYSARLGSKAYKAAHSHALAIVVRLERVASCRNVHFRAWPMPWGLS